jgi:hypothetical protein
MMEGVHRRLVDSRDRWQELTPDQTLAQLGEARGLVQGALHRIVAAIAYLERQTW